MKSLQTILTPIFLALFLIFSHDLAAQRPGRGGAGGDRPTAGRDSTANGKKTGPKEYREVITDKAHSMAGLMTVHKLEDKYYFEIPDSVFGRDIMAITRMSQTPSGGGYGGEQANRQVIRFEKGPSNKVFLRVIDFIATSPDTTAPIYTAVRNSNLDPIAAAFDIKAIRKDTSVVVEVDDFFNNPNQAFDIPPNAKQRYNLTGIQKDRSYIEAIRSYPINVEVRTVKTYGVNQQAGQRGNTGGGGRQQSASLPAGQNAGVVTFELNTSMILLPKTPMRKRFFDPRVGIFATSNTSYDNNGQRAETETIAVRWRLEAKNAADAARQQRGELIEPAKPIVFYIDPATPEKWRPFLKKGVEDWQVAFEQAGWKNAIQAKDWPVQDTTMSLEDARFSVIRYFASTVENAYGPNVHDPRSGEIIESHIGWYHNVMRLLKRWYTTQTAAVDPRARKNEFDDELMGQLVRFVSSHEVGHTLGLRHNFGASNATPVEKLRDKAFTDANGHTSSIMDYARFNYVAQPEDGVTDLYPRIGDYDKWAIEWDYKPIYNSPDAEADKKVLNKWYLEKAAGNPRLHFLTERSAYDPRAQSEDLGDNSMLASEYGIKNLQRILPNIVEWSKEDAEHYERAEEMYGDIVAQFRRYVGHVTKWVGGIFEDPKTYDQPGTVYQPAPTQMQRDAVSFLNKQLFQTPEWLLDRKLFSYIRADQGVAAVSQLQESAINSLLSTSRLQRMMENKAGFPDTYGMEDLFSDLHRGIWSELNSGSPISVYRRNLQKIYVEKLISMLKPEKSEDSGNSPFQGGGSTMDPEKTDYQSVVRADLDKLYKELKKKARSSSDNMSRYHLEDCLARIGAALDVED